MSPRAAWRLERLGYGPVYDYVPGKVDWMAAGLPTVRAGGGERRALETADRDPPTVAPERRLDGLTAADGRGVIVVNEHRIVLGRIPPARVSEASDLLASIHRLPRTDAVAHPRERPPEQGP